MKYLKFKNKIRSKIEERDILLKFYENLSRFKYFLLKPIPDKQFVKLQYYSKTRKKLNLENPKTLSDKVNWLKLNYKSNKNITEFSDKAKFREKMKELGLETYLVPIVGIYDVPEQIEFDKFSKNEVYFIKTTHDSGTVIKFPGKYKKKHILKILEKKMKTNYFWFAREWNYFSIKPRIIVEKSVHKNNSLKEFKFFCFNGKPKFSFVFEDALTKDGVKKTNPKKVIVNKNQEVVPFTMGKKSNQFDYENIKSSVWNEMITISEKVSEKFPFVRVDFMYNGKDLYLGELTFFTGGGNFSIEPERYNVELGNQLNIKNI